MQTCILSTSTAKFLFLSSWHPLQRFITTIISKLRLFLNAVTYNETKFNCDKTELLTGIRFRTTTNWPHFALQDISTAMTDDDLHKFMLCCWQAASRTGPGKLGAGGDDFQLWTSQYFTKHADSSHSTGFLQHCTTSPSPR